MPASLAKWTVQPHGPIEVVADNLWRVEGSLANLPMKRVMTIARLESGAVVVHNPIAVDDGCLHEIEELGDLAFIVVPNGWHRTDLRAFADRYPDATVLAPAGSLAKVREVYAGAVGLDALPADPTVTLSVMGGTKAMEAVMVVTSRDGAEATVVLADAVFNMPHLRGVKGFVLRHVTQSSGGPKLSRVARLIMIKDKAAFRAHLEALAATPNLRRVIVAHHEVIDRDPAGTLRRVAATLS